MTRIDPPAPQTTIDIEGIKLPVRLWWKLVETAGKEGVSANYLVFRLLSEALDFDMEGESYDMVLDEIKTQLDQ